MQGMSVAVMAVVAMILCYLLGTVSSQVVYTRPIYRFIPTPLADQPEQKELERIFLDTSGHDRIVPEFSI